MICDRCLLRISRTVTRPSFHGAPRALNASILSKPSFTFSRRHASTDSAPATPSGASPDASAPPKPAVALSSVPAGTVLKGINYLKNETDPVAREDWEYPAWLWTLLPSADAAASKDGAAGPQIDPNLTRKEKKKLLKKYAKEQAAVHKEPEVPIYEQSIDLPEGDGSLESAWAAKAKRDELKKAMRGKNRATIKETNYLKTMG